MADNIQGPTYFGQKISPVGVYLKGSDPVANKIASREPWQQFGQMASALPALAKLQFGWGAPSINPIAREASRQFQQETLPGLMEQFAGHGSQGALTRGIQGAGSDLMTKLAALQQQQQFELQKQRQEQLPRLLESGLSPSFNTVLTDKPVQGLDPLLSSQIAENPEFQKFLAQQKGLGQDILDVGTAGTKLARQIPRGAYAGAQEAAKDATRFGKWGKEQAQEKYNKFKKLFLTKKFQKNHPEGFKKLESFFKNLDETGEWAKTGVSDIFNRYAESIKTGAQLPVEREARNNPIARNEQAKHPNKLRRGINPKLASQLEPRHEKMIESILKHKRSGWRQAFQRMETIDQLEQLYELSGRRNVKTNDLKTFLNSLPKATRRR